MILEEIKMDEDNPDYLVHEIFHAELLEGSSAGKADPRDQRDGAALRRAILFDYYGALFSPNNMIISAAGNLEA